MTLAPCIPTGAELSLSLPSCPAPLKARPEAKRSPWMSCFRRPCWRLPLASLPRATRETIHFTNDLNGPSTPLNIPLTPCKLPSRLLAEPRPQPSALYSCSRALSEAGAKSWTQLKVINRSTPICLSPFLSVKTQAFPNHSSRHGRAWLLPADENSISVLISESHDHIAYSIVVHVPDLPSVYRFRTVEAQIGLPAETLLAGEEKIR